MGNVKKIFKRLTIRKSMIKHVPVLVTEIINNMPSDAKIIIDWTLGHWWHAEYILGKFDITRLIGIDRDSNMLNKARELLNKYQNKISLIKWSYGDLDLILKNDNVSSVDLLLLDLGVNMEHFKDHSRGFSIKGDWPLDMRFDKWQQFDAKKLISIYSRDQIITMMETYWDFRWEFVKHIADWIVRFRKTNRIETTNQLKCLLKSLNMSENKIAVMFQCIRIEVNNELDELRKFLYKFVDYLRHWGRCMIITYHSIEDRLVKQIFKELVDKWMFKLVNKHVIKPTYEEIKTNNASRSAKLRIIEAL